MDLINLEIGATVEQTYEKLEQWMLSKGASTIMLTREGNTKCVAMSMSPFCAVEWCVANTLEETRGIINVLRTMFANRQLSNVTYITNNSIKLCDLPKCAGSKLTSRCKCKNAQYCCVEHQLQHWEMHKPYCKVPN